MNSRICFVGAGNMSQSLIGGLIASGYDKNNIVATDPNIDQRKNVTEKFAIHCYENNEDAIVQADIVVLSVKPQMLKEVCQSIQNKIQEKKPLIISVAAGIRMQDINLWLGRNLAIVRTMPNTPALIQTGATGLCANANVTEDQKSQSEHILRAAGVTVWVEQEQQLDVITALSGSGPAYYFLMMEAMENAAISMGLDKKTAHLLTMQTALGAAKMVMESKQECAQLRANVTSPNGTTEKAILSFEEKGLRDIVKTAMNAAKDRAEELANELGEPN
jgi:pyrroline-5-carboxylate reductase